MQLKIIVKTDYEDIIYLLNSVGVGVYDGDIFKIEDMLKDKGLMDECINRINIENEVVLTSYIEDEDAEAAKENQRVKDENDKIIKLIEGYKEQSLTLKDFDSYHITFGKDANVYDYRELLETVDKDITLDIMDLSTSEILKLKDINFKVEPVVEHTYNRHEGVLLSELIDTLNIINETKDVVLKYDFSNLEKLIFIYDKVRKRRYIKSKDDGLSHSRDLTKVLKEDSIVCEGYANIFAAVANELGIITDVKYYYPVDGNVGHASNVCYINDEKYNLKSCLEFDATHDRNKGCNSYLNSYNKFGMKIEDREKYLEKKLYPEESSEGEKILYSYDKYLEKQDPSDNMMNKVLKNGVITHIKKLYDKMNMPTDFIEASDDTVFPYDINDNELLKLVDEANQLYNNSINASTFAKALYKVRRVEHALDPDTYPMDMDSIKLAITSRYSSKDRLLNALFEKEPNYTKEIASAKELDNVPVKTPLAKIRYDEKRMCLLHALYKDLDDRSKEEKVK